MDNSKRDFGNLDTNVCLICGNIPDLEKIVLRNKTEVCSSCLKKEERLLKNLESILIRGIEVKSWDFLYYVSFFIFLFLVLFTNFFRDHFWLKCILWFIVSHYIVKNINIQRHKLAQTRTPNKDELLEKIETSIKTLVPIYDQMWEIPPDWGMRKKAVALRDNYKCRECGEKWYKSKESFHIHHKIPKTNAEGDHNVKNLKLLCPYCHKKQESLGHSFILIHPLVRYRQSRFIDDIWHIGKIELLWFKAYGMHKAKRASGSQRS